MKGINVLVLLIVVSGAELTKASENYEDDIVDQFPTPSTRTLLKGKEKKTSRKYRSTTTGSTVISFDENTGNTDTTTDIITQATESPDNVIATTATTSPPSTSDFTITLATTPPPCSDTRFSVGDLNDLIVYATKELKVLDSIKKSYYDDAVHMRNTHIKTLTMFSEWFVEQPVHLKHILEDLSQSHYRIELNISEINKDLKENALTLEDFTMLQTNVARLDKQVNETKVICKYSCLPQPLLVNSLGEIATEVHTEDYYCGKLAEVYNKIKASLKKFSNNTQASLKNHIKEDNATYFKAIDQLQNKLKDIALKQFGHTMYDVLNLIDNYHHLKEKSNTEAVHDKIYRNKEVFGSLKSNLWKIKNHNKKVSERCKQCKNNYALGLFSDSVQKQNGHKDLLEEILEENENNIMNNVTNDYNNIFEGLKEDLNLDNPNVVNNYLENLKKIQEEVTAITKNEREIFTKLLDNFPRQELLDQESIADGAEKISKSLENMGKRLKEIEETLH